VPPDEIPRLLSAAVCHLAEPSPLQTGKPTTKHDACQSIGLNKISHLRMIPSPGRMLLHRDGAICSELLRYDRARQTVKYGSIRGLSPVV